MGRIIAAFGAFILIIILLVVLLTHGDGKKNPTEPVKTLPEYADTNSAVNFTTDGIVNGDEMHRQIRITIAQDRRVVEIIKGYDGEVIDSKSFYNTQSAYDVFLRSINFSGFTAKSKNSKAAESELGQCATGFRYTFTLNNDGDDVSRLWSSSCGPKTGTWGGNFSTTQSLFRAQIPNYFTLTQDVNLQATTQ